MSNSVVTVLDSETALLELQRPLCAVPFHLTEHLPMETTSFCKFCRVHSPQSPCLWQPLLSASVALCTHHKAPVCGNRFLSASVAPSTCHKASACGDQFFLWNTCLQKPVLSASATLCTHHKASAYGDLSAKHLPMKHLPAKTSAALCTHHKAPVYGEKNNNNKMKVAL